jgi:predicted O-linked N-acetylglucosamine transferase (SPINDLY family)
VTAFQLDSLLPGIKSGFAEYYSALIARDPLDTDAHEGLAVLYQDWGKHSEAAAGFTRCMQLLPEAETSRHNWWFASRFKCRAAVCDWNDWQSDSSKLQQLVREPPAAAGEMPLVHPFDSLSCPLEISDLHSIAKQYTASVLHQLGISHEDAAYKQQQPQQLSSAKRRLRVGYVSGKVLSHTNMYYLKVATHESTLATGNSLSATCCL